MAAAVAVRPGMLQNWLQPPVSSKRKRDDSADDSGEDAILNSLIGEATSDEDVLRKGPAKKKKQIPKQTTKPAKANTTTKKPTAKATSTSTSKEAKKLYTETLKAVEKRYIELDKKVKAMSPNSRSITVANYATSAAKHLNTVQKLAAMGETTLAFNFVMALGDASHRRISSFRMSGDTGDCDAQFNRLDEALLALIEKRGASGAPSNHLKSEQLPPVPHRWEREDADVGEFKTSNGPNKQQRGQMDRQYIDWEKQRRAARRSRRETCGDWIAVALADLIGDRDYLKQFGIGEDFLASRAEREENSYFRASIAELEGLDGARNAALL